MLEQLAYIRNIIGVGLPNFFLSGRALRQPNSAQVRLPGGFVGLHGEAGEQGAPAQDCPEEERGSREVQVRSIVRARNPGGRTGFIAGGA